MTGQEFQQEIKTSPKHVYCLISTDGAIIDLYIRRFAKAIGADKVVYGEIAMSNNLLNQKVLSILHKPQIDESLFDCQEYVFIHVDKADKKTNAYKKHLDQIIEVQNDYVNFVMKQGFSKPFAEDFVKKSNNDLGIIYQNLKIHNAGGQIPDYSSDLYLWVENYLKNKPLPRIDEDPIGVLALLSYTCQSVLRVINFDTSGMSSYVVSKNKELAKFRTEHELEKIISACFYLDCQVKRGSIDINYVLSYIIVLGRSIHNAVTD